MNFDDYKKIQAINASSLKQGALSMLHMREAMNGESITPTAAMRLGTLAHKAILEPKEFMELASVFDGDKRSKEWKEFKASHDGDFILTQDEMDTLTAMSDAVHSNKTAHELIVACVPEYTIEWETPEYGKAKGRMDGFSKTKGILEYKTAANIDEHRFGQQCVTLGYDLACGWYVEGAIARGLFNEYRSDTVPQFTFIVQQNKSPYDVAVYYASLQMITLGRKNARKLAIQYRECEKSGVYPGIQADGPKELVMPPWYGEDDIMAGFLDMSEEL
jgi:hypothetical protein